MTTLQSSFLSQQLRQAIEMKYLNADLINQLQLLKSQQELLQSIKKLIEKRKYVNTQILSINGLTLNTNNITNNILDDSFNNNAEQPSLLLSGLDEDLGSKSKLREEMENSTIGGVLRDVQEHCSEETYQIVRKSFLNNRLKDSVNLEKMTAKLIQQRDELASQVVILKIEKANNEKQMEKYRKLISGIDQEKLKIKKKIDYVLKKQNQVFKLQASFAFKQKISLELKKRYERLVGSYITNEAKIQKMYDELYKIWNMVCQKIESSQCEGNCWRKDAFRKAKEQLMEQRKMIKQESAHLEREYQVMSIVSEQFKRIFQQPEKISSTQKFGESVQPNVTKSIRTQQSEISSRPFIKIQ